MATLTKHQGAQALDIKSIRMDASDVVVVDLQGRSNAKVSWDDGGLSWTINSQTAFSVKVEHSLMPEGDEDEFWTEDQESPFTKAAEGNEHYRIQRLRFTANSGTPTIVVASNAKFEVIL